MEFGFALNVEKKDAALQAIAMFRFGFPGAREDDLITRDAGVQSAIEFPRARNVEAGSRLGHEFANTEIGVGLDAIADQRLDFGERLLQLHQMMQQRRLAVNK